MSLKQNDMFFETMMENADEPCKMCGGIGIVPKYERDNTGNFVWTDDKPCPLCSRVNYPSYEEQYA